MERLYPLERYDRHFCLKAPFHLMLAMLYAARHIFIVLLAYSPNPRLASAFAFMQPLASPLYVLTDLPAILVLLAWSRRRPEAGLFWRRLWRHGRTLLTVSLGLHFAFLTYFQGAQAWHTHEYLDSSRLVLVSLGLDLLVVYYLWRIRVVGDVFADFPRTPSGQPVTQVAE
jgi:hypothetical protein